MRILIVAATSPEIEGIIANQRFSVYDCDQGTHLSEKLKIAYNKHHITTLLTGVGMVATAFQLGKHLSLHRYDLAINLGICGSFNHDISLGDVLLITEDTFTEMGAEDDEAFISIDELGFGKSTYKSSALLPESLTLKKATAITVNTVHGSDSSIKKVQGRLSASTESMEGAAFFYACEQNRVPALQIRAVSNYVEKRNREAWQIPLAIKNLNKFANELIEAL